MNSPPLPTLQALLRWRAQKQPDQHAYTFLGDGLESEALSYAELDAQARAIAAVLQETAAPGDRVLLLDSTPSQFVPTLLGCLYAGLVAVPIEPLRPGRAASRLASILADARPVLALGGSALIALIEQVVAARFGEDAPGFIASDAVHADAASRWREVGGEGQDLAVLQYTSGSTSEPHGVMVSHDNLMANLKAIELSFGLSPESVSVSWLPLFHDMGLIDGMLAPLFTGFPAYLMSPLSFLRQPLRWLEAISRYGADHSGGPNFAYELCVRKISPAERSTLRLGSWRSAYNGAEPVRAATLHRFHDAFAPCGLRWRALYPCYGLAEGTLMVSGGPLEQGPALCHVEPAALREYQVVLRDDDKEAQTLVGCGQPVPSVRVRIVDPETGLPCAAERVGEIWVAGESVARGYWRLPEETERTFGARLPDDDGPFLRTGDLGFLYKNQIYIAGRLKDVVILEGKNYYPQDIELVVESSHSSLRPGCSAAFAVEVEGRERLVIAAEVERRYGEPARMREPVGPMEERLDWFEPAPGALDVKEVVRAVRGAVSEAFAIRIHDVVLLRASSIPKTSSGKVRRRRCRDDYCSAALLAVHRAALKEGDR